MTGDCHAGICGSPGVGFPRATRPGSRCVLGMSLGDTRLLPRWCPAYRQHEPGIRLSCGTCEGVPRYCRRNDRRREGELQAAESARSRVPLRGTLADSPVVAVKPGYRGAEPRGGAVLVMDVINRKGGIA